MRFLRQNTATTITVGPFIDSTDGKTPEVAISADNAHITLVVDAIGGSPFTTVTPTLAIDAQATASGGDNDLVHITGDDAGLYTLELTAAQTNYVGFAMLSINHSSASPADEWLPVFHPIWILPANVFDMFTGQDLLNVNTAQINGATVVGDGNATPWDGA